MRVTILRRLSLLLLLLVAVPPILARDGAAPAINRPFVDPDFARWVARFERPGREVYDQREAIVAASGVRPGMRVADVGAGTGLFTLLFARATGSSGRVYAVDIAPDFVDNILRRARTEELTNVTGVVNSNTDTSLAPDSVDLAFVCDTYHHFEQPDAMLASIRRALVPGGTLVVIDFDRAEGKSSRWVLEHVRAGKAQVVHEIEAAGFHQVADEQILKENFFLRFAKAADNKQ